MIAKIEKQGEGAFAITAVFYLVMGSIFIGIDVWDAVHSGIENIAILPSALGGVFFVAGLAYAWKAYRGRRAQR